MKVRQLTDLLRKSGQFSILVEPVGKYLFGAAKPGSFTVVQLDDEDKLFELYEYDVLELSAIDNRIYIKV